MLSYGALRRIRNVTFAWIVSSIAAVAEPVAVVALGDSLTQGYGLPEDEGFVPQMQAWLDAAGHEAVIINAGVSGDTTAGGLARLDWSLTPDVDALIVNLGGNDMLRGIDPAVARANLDAILSAAKDRALPVLLVGLPAPGNYGPDYKQAFDAIFPDLAAQYGTGLEVNFFAPLLNGNGAMVSPDVMQEDGIHPSAKGVTLIVNGLGPKVVELLQVAKGP